MRRLKVFEGEPWDPQCSYDDVVSCQGVKSPSAVQPKTSVANPQMARVMYMRGHNN